MKRIFTIITLLAMIIFAGCTDLDDIYSQLDEQKKDLANVKQLINATTNKLSVVSYKELDDKSGYELSMSDGSKIILKHGAQGEPGEQGKPGEPGAPGPDGDANLTITETDDAIIITYMGVTYTIAKSVPLPTITFTTTRAIEETIRVKVDAAEADRPDVWIDLNNNGNKDDGEAITVFGSEVDYPLGARTVTIYGKVTELNCSSNQLTALDVTNNTALEELRCLFNRLTALDVSKHSALVELSCQYNDLTSLNVDNNTALKVLSCNYNQLTTLNVDNNTALESLSCNYNKLTTLDVSNNTALRFLWCSDNNISGNNMGVLVNSLPDRTGKEAGDFMAIAPSSLDEGNTLALDQAQVATGKNWRVLDDYGNPYTPGIDPAKLIGKWNWVRNEMPDGSGGWQDNGDNWDGYWVHFKDAINGEDAYNFFFTYTLTGNKLEVSEWIGDFTVISVDDAQLVLERVRYGISSRQIYTRDTETPPAIDPAKLIGKWVNNEDPTVILTFNSDGTGSDPYANFNWTLTGNQLTYTNTSSGIPDMTIVSLTDTELVLNWEYGNGTFTRYESSEEENVLVQIGEFDQRRSALVLSSLQNVTSGTPKTFIIDWEHMVLYGTKQIILITNNSSAPITPAIEFENARLRDTDVFYYGTLYDSEFPDADPYSGDLPAPTAPIAPGQSRAMALWRNVEGFEDDDPEVGKTVTAKFTLSFGDTEQYIINLQSVVTSGS
ncbi:MAG: lipocalin family protein [Fermentimonas sp.]